MGKNEWAALIVSVVFIVGFVSFFAYLAITYNIETNACLHAGYAKTVFVADTTYCVRINEDSLDAINIKRVMEK